VVASPAIQQGFGSSYAHLALALLLVPSLVAMALEPVLYLLADRYPRRRFVVGGLLVLSGASFAAALAPSVLFLAIAESAAGVAAGCAVTLAQATLVDSNPTRREQVMTRWVLAGLAGDLLAPLLFAGLAWTALGWRAGFAVAGGAVLVCAWMASRQPLPAPAAPADQEGVGLWAGLRAALGNRRLLVWLAGCALCDLLDEILVVFAALHMRDLGLDAGARSAVLVGFVLGGAVGVALVDRLLARIPPLRLLAASASLCAALYLIWVGVEVMWLSIALFTLVGVTAAPLYPLATAQAYAALPGRSGAVNAAATLFDPIMLALPWLLGLMADAHGTTAALYLLAVQPVGLAAIALLSSGTRSGSHR
jgi:FSR family fosmidomycin resistance protein-like MFS transporter